MVYIVERLVLQTIYVLNKEILQFLSLKSAVYNQERFKFKSGFESRVGYNGTCMVDSLKFGTRPAAPNFGVQIKFWWQTKTEMVL